MGQNLNIAPRGSGRSVSRCLTGNCLAPSRYWGAEGLGEEMGRMWDVRLPEGGVLEETDAPMPTVACSCGIEGVRALAALVVAVANAMRIGSLTRVM